MTELPLNPLHEEFMSYSRFTRQVAPKTLLGYKNAFDLLVKKYLDRTQMKKILLAVSVTIPWQNDLIRTRNIAIIAIALFCGLRRTELLSLKVGDVDLTHGMLLVRGETSKSQVSRNIPLNAQVRRALSEYLDERSQASILF